MENSKFYEFQILNEGNLMDVEGGVVPLIVIGGIGITKGAAVAGGLFAGGIGAGIYFGSRK